MSEFAISMKNVRKRFLGMPALEGVDWSVKEGSVHGLIGANGAGKTTLLRLALGTLRSDSGEVVVLGQNLTHDMPELRQEIQYVAAGQVASPGFHVSEWMRYSSLLYEHWDMAMAQRLLKGLEIDPRKVIGHLSTGMKTSLQIAVALSARPLLLLLDEPTNGLDVVVKQQVQQLIMEMAAQEGTTIVMATHDVGDVERMADTVSVLYRGRFIFQNTMDSIKAAMHRMQVVLNDPWPQTILNDERIVDIKRHGRVAQVTIAGPIDPIVNVFEAAGAVLVEPIEMDLRDIFQSLLEKEGYRRESIQWHAN